jgi:hypothetical protein
LNYSKVNEGYFTASIKCKWGIDQSMDLTSKGTTLEVIEANFKNDVMMGGTKSTYKGIKITRFSGRSPDASITSQMLASVQDMMDRSVF